MHSLDGVSLHEMVPRHRIHYLVYRCPVYARSAGPASLSGRCADGRSCWLIRQSPALTPGPHVPSSTVRHGDGRIPAMRRALHGSRHVSSPASPRVPRFLCRGQRAGGSEPGASIPIQAGSSMPVRELAERRLVQEIARRRAQTPRRDVDIPRRFYTRSPDRSGPWCFRVVRGDVARRRRRNGVSQMP